MLSWVSSFRAVIIELMFWDMGTKMRPKCRQAMVARVAGRSGFSLTEPRPSHYLLSALTNAPPTVQDLTARLFLQGACHGSGAGGDGSQVGQGGGQLGRVTQAGVVAQIRVGRLGQS